MLGGLGALILVELAEDRADKVSSGPFPDILGDRDQLHLGLGKLAPVALELELIPEEAAEAVDDHEVIRAFARGRGLDHRLELRPIVVRRRCARLAVHIDQQDAARLAIGSDRRDLVSQARLMLSLAAGGDADIGGGPRSHLRKSRGRCRER